jgi:hypothetical protein
MRGRSTPPAPGQHNRQAGPSGSNSLRCRPRQELAEPVDDGYATHRSWVENRELFEAGLLCNSRRVVQADDAARTAKSQSGVARRRWWPRPEPPTGGEVGDTRGGQADPLLELFDGRGRRLVVHITLGDTHVADPLELVGQLLACAQRIGRAMRSPCSRIASCTTSRRPLPARSELSRRGSRSKNNVDFMYAPAPSLHHGVFTRRGVGTLRHADRWATAGMGRNTWANQRAHLPLQPSPF